MWDFFKRLFEFFFGEKASAVHKFILIVSVCILVMFINHSIGFTYHMYYSKKISNIKSIQEILDSPNITPSQRLDLLNLQSTLISQKRRLSDSDHKNVFFSFLYFLSHSGGIVLAIIASLLSSLNKKDGAAGSISLGGLVVLVIMGTIGWLVAYIPSPFLAYTICILLQILLIVGAVYAYTPKTQRQ